MFRESEGSRTVTGRSKYTSGRISGASELVRWCRALPAPPRRIFLNHGEDAARKALAATLAELGLPRPELPLAGATAPW